MAVAGSGFEAGRALRERVPRSSHGEWTPADGRPDPVACLTAADADRLPELLPVRYGRMAESPFGFLRGAAALMALDLAPTPVTGVEVQLAGDAHLGNFGRYESPDGARLFGLNDFDETLPGPWEWDVKRLAASAAVFALTRGFPPDAARRAAVGAVRGYRLAVARLARQPHLAVWFAHERAGTVERRVGGPARRDETARRAERAARHDAYPELTDDGLRIRADPPLIVPVDGPDLPDRLARLAGAYRATLPADRLVLLDRYRVADVALKVVGVASVGRRCYVALLVGRDRRDTLFLQVKEAARSALAPHLPARPPFEHEGRRVVEGQRLIQPGSDVFLGWTRDRFDFYVRQLRDSNPPVPLRRLTPDALAAHAALCGRALARAHARSGDAAAIAGYLGESDRFDRAVANFAGAYAEQTRRDHAALVVAIRDGRVRATAS